MDSFDINYQNATNGAGYVYCAKHYKENGVWKSNPNYGGNHLAYTAGNTAFSTSRKDLFLYNKNNLKVEMSGDSASGYLDLSKSGLTSADTYVFRTKFTITETYDQLRKRASFNF